MRKHLQLKAWILLAVFVSETFIPLSTFALTSGPSQPEMAAFTPAGTTEMVDPFTGDFTYNIPLMDVEGYPINIAYSSGVTMEQEASWVGLGWNLNLGTINRSVRGLPDDFKEDVISTYTSMKPMEITKIGGGLGAELFGREKNGSGEAGKLYGKKLGIDVNLNLSFINNSYKGFGVEIGTSLGASLQMEPLKLEGNKGLNLNSLDGASTNSSLGASLTLLNKSNRGGSLGLNRSSGYNTRTGQKQLTFGTTAGYAEKGTYKRKNRNKAEKEYSDGSSLGASSTYLPIGLETYTPYPSVQMTTQTNSFSATVGGEIFGVHSNVNINGSKTTQEIENNVSNKPSYGYLYMQDASAEDLKDFNREKPVTLNNTISNLSPTNFTYDVYSVSGQGVSGTFRPFRNDIGVLGDPEIESIHDPNGTSNGAEIGLGAIFHGGYTRTKTDISSHYGSWNGAHSNYSFKQTEVNSPYENVYLKAAGDLAYTDLGFFKNELNGSEAIAFHLDGMNTTPNIMKEDGTTQPAFSNDLPSKRKLRSKHLALHTAAEANAIHGNSSIYSYSGSFMKSTSTEDPLIASPIDRLDLAANGNVNRKAHHVAEIVQSSPDGERYVFGIAAYNNSKVEKTYTSKIESKTQGYLDLSNSTIINAFDNFGRLIPHTTMIGFPIANTKVYLEDREGGAENQSGKDGYYSRKTVPAYAHSFLLTEKQSTDYQDITGDGVSADDAGNAWKFNYTRTTEDYQWRAPYKNCTFNEGFETDYKDQKASYSYGTKELWYTHSIESKNLVAEFILSDREDGIAANSSDINTGGLPDNIGSDDRMKKLDKIVLYNKQDRIINEENATPIKTIQFHYDYELCKGVENQETLTSNDQGSGKLTLRSIEISYGKNGKGKLSPYEFSYSGENGMSGINPIYNPQQMDRWGNFKNPIVNPSGMQTNNEDFPYVVQESDHAEFDPNAWAAAWSIRQIITPSSGKISIDYESDDYGYIQDRQAMQMFPITGASSDQDITKPSSNYDVLYDGDHTKNRLYFKKPASIPAGMSNTDLKKMFFGNTDRLPEMYFRFKNLIKKENNVDKYEYVSGYVTAVDIGYATGGELWVELVGNDNPISKASWGFFRENLSEILYDQPNIDQNNFEAFLKGIKANFADIKQMFTGVAKHLRDKNIAGKFKPGESFIRLQNPNKTKLGGGSRVSKIELNDNWNAISGEEEATYGQEYDYTTLDEDGNTISSGVATYEPTVGNEENPWRTPVPYIAQQSQGHIPSIESFQETPFGESFFPNPSIGYSQVRVTNIHSDKGQTANAITEHRFYTAKDFPVQVRNTHLSGGQKYHHEPRERKMAFPFKNRTDKSLFAASQGYSIILNDMHGKPQSTENYAMIDANGIQTKKIISGTKYNYREELTDKGRALNNEVDVLLEDGTVDKKLLGLEYDLCIDNQRSFNQTKTTTTMANVDIFPTPGLFGLPLIIPIALWSTVRNIQEARTAVVTKVVQQYGLIESVEAYTDQYATETFNKLYDGQTGQVLLTESKDEYRADGSQANEFQFTIPAYQTPKLQRMGPASANQGFEMSIEDEVLSTCVGSGHYRHNGNLVHGDQVLITKTNGTTQEAWVDLDIPNNAKDPYFKSSKDCEYNWKAVLMNYEKKQTDSYQEVNFCNNQSNSIYSKDFDYELIRNELSTTHSSTPVKLYLPKQEIIDFFLEHGTGTYSDPETQFCLDYGSANSFFGIQDNSPTSTNVNFSIEHGYNESNSFLIASQDFDRSPSNAIEVELIEEFSKSDDFSEQENLLIKGITVKGSIDDIDNHPNLRKVLLNDKTNKPFNISIPILAQFQVYAPNPFQVYPPPTENAYFIFYYQRGRTFKVNANNSNYDLTNPWINNGVVINDNYSVLPECPNTYRLVDRSDTYINDLQQGDQLKVIRSGNRNMLAANEGLVIADQNPILLEGNRFVGIRPTSEIKMTQISSQEFSDEYAVSSDYSNSTYNKFLLGSDGKFKVTRTQHYNASRYQNEAGVETAEDGYMQTPPLLWSSANQDCFFIVKSPIQEKDDSWLLTEEILTFSESGSSSEATNSLDIHSSVLLNPLGRVEAVASNAQRKDMAVESFENYKHLDGGSRNWNSHFQMLSTISPSVLQVGNCSYNETSLNSVHNQILVKGVAHTGDYSIFLKGENPTSLTTHTYTEKPINSLVNHALGTATSSTPDPLDLSGYPNSPIDLPALEAAFPNNYSTEVATELAAAMGTSNGLNKLTKSITDRSVGFNNTYAGHYRMSVWVKEILPSNTPYKGSSPTIYFAYGGTPIIGQTITQGPEIDGWYQIQCDFYHQGSTVIEIALDGGLWGAFFDDLRIHKVESNMQTYVYDMLSGRLKAQLDENNYATFYDYDEAGILSQVRRETAAGVLTVSESRQSLRNR